MPMRRIMLLLMVVSEFAALPLFGKAASAHFQRIFQCGGVADVTRFDGCATGLDLYAPD